MSLESALFTLITSNAPVAAVMGTRLYRDFVPQDVPKPYGYYKVVNNRVPMAHSGPAGVEFGTVRYTVFDESRAGVIALREVIKTATSGFKGVSDGETLDAVFYREGSSSGDTESEQHWCQFDLTVTRRV